MWYSVRRIAADNFLDEEIALSVAEKSNNATKLDSELYTNTPRMDDLIREIIQAQGLDTVAIRHNQIAERFANLSNAI